MSFWKGLLAGLFGKEAASDNEVGGPLPSVTPAPNPSRPAPTVTDPASQRTILQFPLPQSPDRAAVEHPTFALSGAADYQEELAGCEMLMEVDIEDDPDRDGAYIVYLKDGDAIGRISAKQAVAKALNDGNVLLHAVINSCGTEDAKGRLMPPRLRVVTGPRGSSYLSPPFEERPVYPVGLVGEQHYQDAVRRCAPGDEVVLLTEVGNPHDKHAIVVVDRSGQTLGYIPKDNWLYAAVNLERKGATARVKSSGIGQNGFLNVVIEPVLNRAMLGERRYVRS